MDKKKRSFELKKNQSIIQEKKRHRQEHAKYNEFYEK